MAAECSGSIEFDGRDHISIYDSSQWAERGFCSNCGTHLFYKVKRAPEHYIPIALFREIEDFVFSRQIFVDQKPNYYHFGEQTELFNSDEIPLSDPPDA